jgi:hypothetical protein
MTSKEIKDFFKSQTRATSNNSRKHKGRIPYSMMTYETIEDILAFLTPTTVSAFASQTRRGDVILRKR